MNPFQYRTPKAQYNYMNNSIYPQEYQPMMHSNYEQFKNHSREHGNYNPIYNQKLPQSQHYPCLPTQQSTVSEDKSHTSLPQCSPAVKKPVTNNSMYPQEDQSMIHSNYEQFKNHPREHDSYNPIYNQKLPHCQQYPCLQAPHSLLFDDKRHASLPQCSPAMKKPTINSFEFINQNNHHPYKPPTTRISTPPSSYPYFISTSDASGSDYGLNSTSYKKNIIYSINSKTQNNHIQGLIPQVAPKAPQICTSSSTSKFDNFLPSNSSVPSHQYYIRNSYHSCLPHLPFTSYNKKIRGTSNNTTACFDVTYDETNKRPQSFRDDPNRRARVKTELCEKFKAGEPCPFGDKCSFAHGEEELKLTKLYDLQAENLEDIETYRTRPCFDWIATGSWYVWKVKIINYFNAYHLSFCSHYFYSPFNTRCKCIHDPRLIGDIASWLPHSEMKVNTLPTDVNVNNLHHMRLQWNHHGSPFGSLFKNCNEEMNFEEEWKKLYDRIGNKTKKDIKVDNIASKISSLKMRIFQNRSSETRIFQNRSSETRTFQNRSSETRTFQNRSSETRTFIDEIHKTEIALKMFPSKDEYYTYQPTHIIYNEMCMIVKTRAFRIPIKCIDSIIEIDVSECNPYYHSETSTLKGKISRQKDINNRYHDVIVREIAFGSLGDESIRQVALWFDIPNNEIAECTPQQTKRRKRTMKRLKQQQVKMATNVRGLSSSSFQRDRIVSSGRNIYKYNIASFDEFPIRPFYIMYTLGHDAHHLVRGILQYQLKLYQHENGIIVGKQDRSEKSWHDLVMPSELKILESRFVNLIKHWSRWSWKVNEGREKVNGETEVPDVDGEYHFPSDSTFSDQSNFNPSSKKMFQKVNYCNSIWLSCIDNLDSVEEEKTSSENELCFDIDCPEEAIFTRNTLISCGINSEENEHQDSSCIGGKRSRRLPCFQNIINNNNTTCSLPHIACAIEELDKCEKEKNTMFSSPDDGDRKEEQLILEKSEKCWKALLLTNPSSQCQNNVLQSSSQEEKNEWDLVHEYYDYQKFLNNMNY